MRKEKPFDNLKYGGKATQIVSKSPSVKWYVHEW